jgi:hypothetical protein
MMTFAEFRATRRDVADVRGMEAGTYLEDVSEPQPGLVYLDQLIIEQRAPWWPVLDGYRLTIANQRYGGHVLYELERRLYEFACSEGMCGEEPAIPKEPTEVDSILAAADMQARLTLGQLAKVLALNTELLAALKTLLADAENLTGGKAYGLEFENEQHPLHRSIMGARAALRKAGEPL